MVGGLWAGARRRPVQLTWYFIGNGPQKDVDKVQAAVDKYIQSQGCERHREAGLLRLGRL